MLFRYDGDGHNDSNDDNDGEDNMIIEIDEQQVWKCEALNIDGVKVKQNSKSDFVTRYASSDHSENHFQTCLTSLKRFCRAQVLWR